jgi:hypothetical protein
VLVSDTVRGLTSNVLPIAFVPRGRRRLKGIAEPVSVYAVRAGRPRPRPAMPRVRAGPVIPALAAVLVLAAAIAVVAVIALLTERAPAGALSPTGSATISAGATSTGTSATPTSAPVLNARERQLLEHVPALYRASCTPSPGIIGRAELVCAIPDVGLVTYTQFDSADAMQADYDRRWRPRATPVPFARRCREEAYERPYVGSTGVQRGRYVCWEEPFGPSIAWTDESLAIVATLNPQSPGTRDLYAFVDWWEEGLAGPIP